MAPDSKEINATIRSDLPKYVREALALAWPVAMAHAEKSGDLFRGVKVWENSRSTVWKFGFQIPGTEITYCSYLSLQKFVRCPAILASAIQSRFDTFREIALRPCNLPQPLEPKLIEDTLES